MKRFALPIIAAAAVFAAAVSSTPRPAASQVAPAARPPVPAYSHGSPDNMTVYLDFGDRLAGGGVALGDGEVFTIFMRVAEKLVPPLGVTVTTVPPDARPGEFVTVRFLSDTVLPYRDTVGNCPRKMIFNDSWYVPNVVYVARMEPNSAGVVAAHEAAHCMQPDGASHEETAVGGAPNLMSGNAVGTASVMSPNMALLIGGTIDEFAGGWRLGPYLRDNGTWFFDWHRIGP